MRLQDALLAIQHIDLLLLELFRSAAGMLVVVRTILTATYIQYIRIVWVHEADANQVESENGFGVSA